MLLPPCCTRPPFYTSVTEVTGIKALLPDPYLRGAGFHVIEEGGKIRGPRGHQH